MKLQTFEFKLARPYIIGTFDHSERYRQLSLSLPFLNPHRQPLSHFGSKSNHNDTLLKLVSETNILYTARTSI